MISQDIRRGFLEFFKNNGHSVVPSSSVVPHDDPSLLFINAGMNQFKDVFLGNSARDYTRATTSQKCIRVGGKHNDLDNVGHTTRHLTFFEMLGNFSFGDFFKKEAIEFAWKVSNEVFKLPEDKIWVSVFETDDEAFELWKKFVPESRIVRFGESENFWSMGDTGPCGPCSELLFDRGNKYSKGRTPYEDPSGERFFEFWNLVFMQFNRQAGGQILPLSKQSIDTGSGLERVASLQMGVGTVFETDIFRSLIAQIENVTGIPYDINDKGTAPAFHVIADHIRSLAFAIGDGAQPSNIERGYVLRKILRRAVRYSKSLGVNEPFLAKILPRLVEVMGEDFPELISSQARTAEILTLEEESFFRTLKRGGSLLNQVVEKSQKDPRKQIEGADAFKLKDTYGLPLEEILLIAKDTGLQVNLESYQILEELAKEKSRAAEDKVIHKGDGSLFKDFTEKHGKSTFCGYNESCCEGTLLGIVRDGEFVQSLESGEEGILILNTTPFYAEKGGQVGDKGTISHHQAHFTVSDCKTPFPDVIIHIGKLEKGTLLVGEPLVATINLERRLKISNNHTATHLLHAALQKVLGPHIRQAGSLVEGGRLRFDFNHHKAISKEELRLIEKAVSEKIREDITVSSYETSYEDVQKQKEIKQFFGDKYGARVRVVDIAPCKELCGGTHAKSTGTIGSFRIAKEGSVAAGVRRIEAVTGKEAEDLLYEKEDALEHCSALLKTPSSQLARKIEDLLKEGKAMAAEIKSFKQGLVHGLSKDLLSCSSTVNGSLFLTKTVSLEMDELQSLAEMLSKKESSYLIALAIKGEGQCHLLLKVSKDLQEKGLLAGALIKQVAPTIGGNGGGRPDSAQAKGKNPQGIDKAFSILKSTLEALC
jgi:alanyl-tRNA synthetase